MSMVTGVVEAKARTGKGIKVGDLWYSAFTAATLDGVERGDEVSFESVLDKTGKYNNIKGAVKKGGTTVPVSGASSDGTLKVLKPSLDRERSIIRQNALTNAREHYSSVVDFKALESLSIEETCKAVIEVARIFEAYTSGDADIEVAKEALSKMEVE
jgi:hypothetical protein